MANSKKKTSTSSNKAAKKTTAKKTTNTKSTTKKVETKPVVKEEKKLEVKPIVKEEKKVERKVRKEKRTFGTWCKENYMLIGLIVLAILLIGNIIIVSNGHKVKLLDGKEIVASVKGKKVLAEELFDELKEKYGQDALLNLVDAHIVSKEISDEDKVAAKKSAQENIDSIKEQYKSAGYEWEKVLSQYGYASEDVLLEEMTLSASKETVAKNAIKKHVTEEQIKKYYDENRFGKYTAKHILITPDTNDDMSDEEKTEAENRAKDRAQEVINRLNDGANWNDLVNEYSDDTGSKENEGLVEDFTKGDVVDEFWNAVEKLEDGKYTSEPVKSSYGYHVIYRVSYTEKDALDDIKDELVDEMIEKMLSEDSNLYTNTWVDLRKEYKLSINDTIIKSKYEATINKNDNEEK